MAVVAVVAVGIGVGFAVRIAGGTGGGSGETVPADLTGRVAAAAAQTADLRVGIAALDLDTGERFDAGDTSGEFGTASVVKVLIAARLLAEGRMTGDTERLARAMIERSDDDAADTLWSRTGTDGLEPWVADHWGIANLGSPNQIPGRWGNTHATASGLAELYAALRADPAVWPWLSNAMHHVDPVAADGTHQTFGVFAADPSAAVKQGWANGSADVPENATINSTGFVADDRLVVVILTEGRGNNSGDDDRGFNSGQAREVTAMARTILR